MASISGTSSTTTSNYYLLNTGTSSNLQISGLASGIDVDSIVNKLMQAESVPLDTMNQKLQLLEWKRDDYRSMSSQLSDLLNIVNTMTLQSSYTKAATVSDPTKVTVTPASGAGNGTYTISSATLATAAMTYSHVNASQDFDPSKPLIEQVTNLADGISWTTQSAQDEEGSPESHSVSADGKVFKLNNGAVNKDSLSVSVTDKDGVTTSYTVFDSEEEFNTSEEANKVLLNKTTGQLTFNNTIEKDSTIDASYEYNTVKIDLTTYDSNSNEKRIQFDANGSMSLNSILQKINSYGTVNTFYDSTSKQVSVAASATGDLNKSGNDITFNTSFLTTTLGLKEAVNGTDANVTVNGMPMTSSSNTFTINNTTFTLNQEVSSGQTVTIGIDTDTDGMFDKIKSFVDKYNETIDKINSMTSVAPNRDYSPLTAAQKAQMSDSDITNWNEKARQGTLYNDTILNSSLSKMRQDIYGAISGITGGSYSQISQIGITTSQNYMEHGKLIIDESKLQSAIASDPDSVMKLFTNGNTSTSNASSMGIAKRLFNTITDTVSKIKTQAGTVSLPNDQFYIGKSIDNLNDEISSFQDHLKMIQTRYYTQFTAMEQAIQQANSQATFIQNAFS
ncbi:flagellar filament capping protein FliD [Sporolactobacillus shoreicorticis]|uniref:Flagellar hook-associated protein 2 n=1 Tax=Sporolactobacillus shoreicorticis TaxID=1923877 RepID=A0ABW5RY29_9BACL|nr:flagellar filament capping protein FliD [Sporolactobacillus shoreicorticis]MCO7125021.1 flagellar filament capping protein FliD [Sporolactobacillus shoreicorticis]